MMHTRLSIVEICYYSNSGGILSLLSADWSEEHPKGRQNRGENLLVSLSESKVCVHTEWR